MTTGRKPSKDRRKEAEDLEGILSFVRTMDRVDNRRIVLAGKSLGAAVCYRTFRSNPEIAGAVLLTPVFRDHTSGERNYPDLPQETRPLKILAGNRDPLNNLQVMHSYLENAGENLDVAVVDGDHSLNIFRSKDPDKGSVNEENINAAVGNVVNWLTALFPAQ
jgi:dienelactone hydrolase